MRNKTGNGHGHNANIEQFLEDIKTVVRDGEDLLKAGASEVKERARIGAQTTDRIVRSHPYQTLGIVFGLGLIAGLLLMGSFSGGESEEEEE